MQCEEIVAREGKNFRAECRRTQSCWQKSTICFAHRSFEAENFCGLEHTKRKRPWNIRVKHFLRGRPAKFNSTSVPLRGAIKVNLDDLLGIGDVVPVAVGLPAFRDNLNEDAADGRLRNMGDALHVGLDVEFGLFVFD